MPGPTRCTQQTGEAERDVELSLSLSDLYGQIVDEYADQPVRVLVRSVVAEP